MSFHWYWRLHWHDPVIYICLLWGGGCWWWRMPNKWCFVTICQYFLMKMSPGTILKQIEVGSKEKRRPEGWTGLKRWRSDQLQLLLAGLPHWVFKHYQGFVWDQSSIWKILIYLGLLSACRHPPNSAGGRWAQIKCWPSVGLRLCLLWAVPRATGKCERQNQQICTDIFTISTPGGHNGKPHTSHFHCPAFLWETTWKRFSYPPWSFFCCHHRLNLHLYF